MGTVSARWRLAAGLVALALGSAACGGAGPGVASLGSTTTTTQAAAPGGAAGSSGALDTASRLRFARCMRSHGVAGYPDPGGALQATGAAVKALDPNAPAFRRALATCQRYLPKGGPPASPAERAKVEQEALAFAHCMQTHGMPEWPDPTARGYMVAPVGAAATAPGYLRAQKACASLLPTG